MWRRLLFALVLNTAFACVAQADPGSLAMVDADNGLPDARLTTHLNAIGGLQKIEDTGRWLTFTRPADKLEFLGVRLKGITYNFFKDQLYSIDLELDGRRNVGAMLKVLEKRYGKETSLDFKEYPNTSAKMEVREWAAKKVYCVYKSASDKVGAELVYVDRPTWDQLQVPRAERAAQARTMLQGSFINGDF